jgi:hypothetical protein
MSEVPFQTGFELSERGVRAKEKGTSDSQKQLADVMARSLQELFKNHRAFGSWMVVQFILMIVYGAAFTWLTIAGYAWVIERFGWPLWILYAYVLLPIVVLAIWIKLRLGGWVKQIPLDRTQSPPVIRFVELNMAIGSGWAGYAFILGMILGTHAGLLHCAPDHGGLDKDNSGQECLLITIDNVSHGVFDAACQQCGLPRHDAVTHSQMSKWIFVLISISFDLAVVGLVVSLWKRRRVHHLATLYRTYAAPLDYNDLKDFLRKACYHSRSWSSAVHDEFVFFCIVEKYLSGRFTQCRELAGLFPDIGVPLEIQELFKDAKGQRLIPTAEENI